MRLLMVEDDPTIASFLVKGLQEAGYAVAPAAHHQVPTLHRQHRLFCASTDPSSSAPTLLRQFRLFIVSTDSSTSVPTLHRQHRPFCVSSCSSSSAPTLLRQFLPLQRQHRLFCVSSDSSSSAPTLMLSARLRVSRRRTSRSLPTAPPPRA